MQLVNIPCKISSTQLRATLSRIEDSIASAGDTLVAADTAYNDLLREHIASGATVPPPAPPSALNAARDDLSRLALTRDETRRMLAEAEQREKDEADEKARAKLCPLIAEIKDAGSRIDEAVIALVEGIRLISSAQPRAQAIISGEMQREIYGGVVIWGAATDIASAVSRHLNSLRTGNPTDLEPFGARGAERLAKQIKSAARIPDTEGGED